MNAARAYRLEAIPESLAHAGAVSTHASKGVVVEIAGAAQLASIQPAWTDLLARTDAPNVFMDPALIAAAARIDPAAGHRALLAWKSLDGERQLVGIWTFVVSYPRKSALPLNVMTIPSCPHGYLSTPVLDRDCIDETLDAMLDCIADAAQLPKIVALDALATDGPVYQGLLRVLANRASTPCIFAQSQRPKLASELDGKAYLEQALSSSTRKKLRQHRRKLSEKGLLTSEVAAEPHAVRRALEEFLAIEAAGWKGRQGTALLDDPGDAAFMRAAIDQLAKLGCASIHALYLDGKAVSMQIVVRAGAAAFTWKTTYDEAFQDFSPGMLLLEDYTAAFLADKTIGFVDSCSLDATGFMAAWGQRQAVADLWIDARRGGSLELRMLGALQRNYRNLRAAAKTAYLGWRKSRKG